MVTELDLINTHPAAHRADLPRIKTEWSGRRVAVRFIKHRGTPNRRTTMGWSWGVLTPAAEGIHIAVRDRSGTVHNIHFRRVTAVYDLTRPKSDETQAARPTRRAATPTRARATAPAAEVRDPGVPASMNPSRAARLEHARGALTQWDAMRRLCRSYDD